MIYINHNIKLLVNALPIFRNKHAENFNGVGGAGCKRIFVASV